MSLDGEDDNMMMKADPGENPYGDTGADAGPGENVAWPRSLLESCGTHMALLTLMERTGYNMLQVNGQRTYGGPPPGWEGPPPPHGCEVFIGKIPRDMYEDELVPLFERAGQIYEFRLMLEFSGLNRGYGFVKFSNRDEAQRAIQILDNCEVRPGKFIGVCPSVDNCRLFISPIPRDEMRENILEEMKMVTEGVVDVIVPLSSSDEEGKNRGFAFVEYDSHKAAALARRKLITVQPWGYSIRVKWAESETFKDRESSQAVQVLYVCNVQPQTSEETLQQEFSHFNPGCVERVKKLRNYAFIHYRRRSDAMMALSVMNGAHIDGAAVEVRVARDRRGTGGRGHPGEGGGGGRGPSRTPSPLQNGQRNPIYNAAGGGGEGGGGEDPDQCLVPLLPDTPLTPTSPLALKASQISSAVSLLEYYCIQKFWSPPEYYLFSTPEPSGGLLLIYKVVIPSTRRTFMADALCQLLDDAKELAAKTTLWNLGNTGGLLSMI